MLQKGGYASRQAVRERIHCVTSASVRVSESHIRPSPNGISISLISFSGMCAHTLSVNTAPWYQENAPGLIRFIVSLAFPIGLVMITLTGTDLFTTNIMVLNLRSWTLEDARTDPRSSPWGPPSFTVGSASWTSSKIGSFPFSETWLGCYPSWLSSPAVRRPRHQSCPTFELASLSLQTDGG